MQRSTQSNARHDFLCKLSFFYKFWSLSGTIGKNILSFHLQFQFNGNSRHLEDLQIVVGEPCHRLVYEDLMEVSIHGALWKTKFFCQRTNVCASLLFNHFKPQLSHKMFTWPWFLFRIGITYLETYPPVLCSMLVVYSSWSSTSLISIAALVHIFFLHR